MHVVISISIVNLYRRWKQWIVWHALFNQFPIIFCWKYQQLLWVIHNLHLLFINHTTLINHCIIGHGTYTHTPTHIHHIVIMILLHSTLLYFYLLLCDNDFSLHFSKCDKIFLFLFTCYCFELFSLVFILAFVNFNFWYFLNFQLSIQILLNLYKFVISDSSLT